MHKSSDHPFKHIRRMKDSRFPSEIAVIMPGEHFVDNHSLIVYTVLGSCISVCIRDPLMKLGGMNHFMLPAPKGTEGHDSWGESGRYGSYAMELLVNDILKLGGNKSRFEVKVFGGAKIYEGLTDVGAKNADWITSYLAQEGLKPIKVDIGDVYPRKVYYFTDSGRVLMKKIQKVKNRTILDREEEYQKTLGHQQDQGGDVTLF